MTRFGTGSVGGSTFTTSLVGDGVIGGNVAVLVVLLAAVEVAVLEGVEDAGDVALLVCWL